ncbi:MAG: hypothetical protein ACE5J1_04300, partial [Nitrospiria bacterium]
MVFILPLTQGVDGGLLSAFDLNGIMIETELVKIWKVGFDDQVGCLKLCPDLDGRRDVGRTSNDFKDIFR